MTSNSILLSRRDLPLPETVNTRAGIVSLFTSRSPDKETDNEDAVAVLMPTADSLVLIVADGLGGERAGSEASYRAIKALEAELVDISDAEAIREGILRGIETANESIRSMGIGAATTLAIVEIQQRRVRTYHVGDSAILVCGQRGKDKFQSMPHSPTGYAVEAGLMDESDAMQHEHRHLVSNVVGSEEMRIDMGPVVELAERDTVLLASDGLTDNLYYDEIVETIRRGNLEAASQHLLAHCHQRMHGHDEIHPGKPDDLTFILFRPARNTL